MKLLRTNTACRITVGPFFDKTDGVTPETSLTVTSCKLTFLVDAANVPTLVIDANATESAGNNDMVHVSGDDAGYYDLKLTAAQTNYLGRASLAITDAANHCPVFHEFMILPAMIYDSVILGTDRLDANVTHVADQSQTARDIGLSVLVSSGTGTGQISLTSGLVTLAGVTHTNAVIPTVTNTGTLAGAATVVLTDDSLTAAKIASGAITAGKIASDAITAGKIAADAIGVSEFSADLIAAIQAGLSTYAGTDTPGTTTLLTRVTGAVALASALVSAQTTLDAINLKTTNLPSDPADASDITGEISTLTSALGVIAAYIDTEVAAIKAKTDQLVFTTPNKVDATATATLDQSAIDDIADGVVAAIDIPTSAEIAADLSAGAITITTSPITLGNALNIYTGDDYKAANSKSITFALVSRSDLIGLIPHLVGKSGTVTFDIAAPAVASATQTITFGDLSSTVTLTLKAGSEENPHEGEYQVRFLDGSGNKVTQVSGVMYVRTGLSD